MEMEGAKYVGVFGKILKEYDISDIEKRSDLIEENHPILTREGTLYISYLNAGGIISLKNFPQNISANWIHPRSGKREIANFTADTKSFMSPDKSLWVLIVETE